MAKNNQLNGRFGPHGLALVSIFIAAGSLRVWLAILNREANDNHHEVMQLLMSGLRNLNMSDCHECFHPKLYYVICVGLFKLFQLHDPNTQIVLAQMLNVTAGLTTLGFVWTELVRHSRDRWNLYAAFALVALNPRLIGINCQASNDSFAILFSTMAIVFALRTLRTNRPLDGLATCISLALAVLVKGTSWPAAVAVVMLFMTRALSMREWRLRYGAVGVATVAMCLAGVQFGGYDFGSYEEYAHLGKGEPLHLVEQTYVGRPGVVSVVDSYMSFRLIGLIRQPTITNGTEIDPRHRTSLWSQLYGRAHFIHFDNWPHSWRALGWITPRIGRLAMLLGLPSLGCLLLGVWVSCRDLHRGFKDGGVRYLGRGERYYPLLVGFGYIAFIVLFSYNYRDFASMKVIYILPGLVAFASLFLRGLDSACDPRFTPKIVRRSLRLALGYLALLYVVDISILLHQLS